LNKTRIRIWIGCAIALAVVIILAWWLFHSNTINVKMFTPGYIRDWVLAFGPWSVLVYIGIYVYNLVLIFPPNVPIALSAGLIFGHLAGAALIMVSALIGTSLTFWIGRSIERKYLDQLIQGRWKDVSDKLEHNGFITVLFLRVIPIVPFEILNYLCGLSRIRYRDFFCATLLGMIPSAVLYGFFGGTLGEINEWRDIFSFKIILGMGLAAIFITVTALVIFLRSKKTAGRRQTISHETKY